MADSCDDGNFNFNKTWWYAAIATSTICLFYILIDYSLNSKIRRNPSFLMLSRAFFDYIAVIIVLYAILSDQISCEQTQDNYKICQFWGALFLFSLYAPAIYYGAICWQLYLTLRNPFRTPSSHSFSFHFVVLFICFVVVLIVATVGNNGAGQFEYRASFQICFMKQRDGLNSWNLCVIYIPTFFLVTGGIFANLWSIKQLKRRILDDTFELRWIVIKTQTAIITCFTINYILQGINWIIIFDNTEKKPKHDPYLLSIFCFIAIFFDALTWFIRNTVQARNTQKHDQHSNIALTATKKKINNISDALRKEVITFITAGLAQSATLNSSKNVKRRRKRSINVNIVDDSGSINANDKPDGASSQLLSEKTEIAYEKIGNFSQLFRPNITENYFLMSDEEKSDFEEDVMVSKDQTDLLSTSKCELASVEDQKQQLQDYTDILSDKYYPTNIDGQYKEHVIEEYPIGSVGAEQTNVVFTDYAPVIFSYLRRNVFGVTDEQYKHSILPDQDVSKVSLALIAKFSEGRSGAFFFFTKDMKYLIKTLTKDEAQLLLTTLKKYTLYMVNNGETYLSKYFGLHSILLYSHSIYFVVNKNVFPSLYKSPNETYDIKGSWVDRHTQHHVTDRKLMKDSDLHSKLVLNKPQAEAMNQQLKADTLFLSSVNIMDYSLLLGIFYTKVHRRDRYKSVIHLDINENEELKQNGARDRSHSAGIDLSDYNIYDSVYVEGPGRYVIGVIDMLQKWDWNKKTERFIKGLRGKDRNGVSCVPPQQYQQRFMEKMVEIGIGDEEQENDGYQCNV